MNPWAIVVGRRVDGADEVMSAIVSMCRGHGLHVGGVRQERVDQGDERVGYDLVNLSTEERVPLARAVDQLEQSDLCDLTFDQHGFATARDWLTAPQLDVVVLPVGLFEAKHRGHWPALKAVFNGPERVVLLHVRPDALSAIAIELHGPVAGIELPATATEIEELVDALVHARRAPGEG